MKKITKIFNNINYSKNFDLLIFFNKKSNLIIYSYNNKYYKLNKNTLIELQYFDYEYNIKHPKINGQMNLYSIREIKLQIPKIIVNYIE